MKNPMEQFVLPSKVSVSADAAQHPGISATHFSITNSGHREAYPISGYSWALLYKRQPSAASGTATIDALYWMTTVGQKYAGELDYVPLPAVVQATALKALEGTDGPSGQPLLTKAVIAKYSAPAAG